MLAQRSRENCLAFARSRWHTYCCDSDTMITKLSNTLLGLSALFACACAGSHGATADAGTGTDSGLGVDAGFVVDSGTGSDAGMPVDASTIGFCERAMDVAVDPCVDVDCAPGGPTLYFWDGVECALWPYCAQCVGEDCSQLTTLELCQNLHSTCLSVLCEATGGYFRAELAYCGNFECGHPGPNICESPTSACDCGIGKVFDATLGCVESAGCGPEDLCRATHGDWRLVVIDSCGNETMQPAVDYTCDCGDKFVFNEERGCEAPSIDVCLSPSSEEYCARSGGSWGEGCNVQCGQHLDCDCIDCFSCACGPEEVFDISRGGCVRDPMCSSRARIYDECANSRYEGRLCEEGYGCCQGGAGGPGHCEQAQCSSFGICGPPRP